MTPSNDWNWDDCQCKSLCSYPGITGNALPIQHSSDWGIYLTMSKTNKKKVQSPSALHNNYFIRIKECFNNLLTNCYCQESIKYTDLKCRKVWAWYTKTLTEIRCTCWHFLRDRPSSSPLSAANQCLFTTCYQPLLTTYLLPASACLFQPAACPLPPASATAWHLACLHYWHHQQALVSLHALVCLCIPSGAPSERCKRGLPQHCHQVCDSCLTGDLALIPASRWCSSTTALSFRTCSPPSTFASHFRPVWHLFLSKGVWPNKHQTYCTWKSAFGLQHLGACAFALPSSSRSVN